ncbi:hypothetical protein HMPREF1624_06244 [Sporothrix schenckii ATCC 58251]|uniref:Methyltransferase type 11 domain-containing protein n=1 Tax=Sporothrix schenckii (strain ATCC 58251 / de Perez 2211183) TaxID=1391915 RepID=U7PMX9_SPOS1|nr:hypothetical protein HMPREF1624_06244 [Sporothrix schenckii ATCC 58251]
MSSAPQETTFRKYNAKQGEHYANARPDYHPSVYDFVTTTHKATGGQFDILVDLGCGPGNVARALAPQFAHAYGIDPAPGMLATAKELGGTSASGEAIHYGEGGANDFGAAGGDADVALKDGTVDLVAVGNAAHWFDMQQFWKRAAQVLKPGGSVALWTTGDLRIHPDTPAADAVQAAIDHLHDNELKPYFKEGNYLVLNQYRDLLMPWTVPEPVAGFPQSELVRRDWTISERFMTAADVPVNMDVLEKVMSTSSIYTRWAEANPDRLEGEDNVLRKLRREVERLIQATGVEKGKETVRGVALGVVLIVKKAAA